MKNRPRLNRPGLRAYALLALALLAFSGLANADPTLVKTFTPSTIGPGSVSTITFTITNDLGSPVTGLAFTDTLPIAPGPMTIANPANASTDCDLGVGGALSAPDGGSTITLSGAQLADSQSCTITVDVTASTTGVHTNPAIVLLYNEQAGDPPSSSSVNLTVTTTLPGFSKAFDPDVIMCGNRSTLTFTIDNSANASDVVRLEFTDNLPTGMVIADPANAATDCESSLASPTLTADAGTSVITLLAGASPALAANATCTVVVDVTTEALGGPPGTAALTELDLDNSSGELFANYITSGKANARLTATAERLHIAKSFTDDPAPPGGTVELGFTIYNLDRSDSVVDIQFSDDLEATLSDLAPAAGQLPMSAPCGTGSTLFMMGTTMDLTGGSIPPGDSCTFWVTLDVPLAATPGQYGNTTTTVTGDYPDSADETGNEATAILRVQSVPLLTKEYTDDPVAAGGSVTLEFSITNTSPTSTASDITFIDEYIPFLPLPNTLVTLPPVPDPPCGAGSALDYVTTSLGWGLGLTGGTLATGATCTFAVTVDIPVDFPGGTYTNTTEQITATVDGATAIGPTASDDLVVVGAPRLTKEFTDDPVAPGGTVTLEFTISHNATAPTDATAIGFTDNLAAMTAGIAATGLPQTDICGAGSQISGTTDLTFTDGTLAPGASCTFSVTLAVDAAATPGIYTNTTSNIVATVDRAAVTGNPGEGDLLITGLTFSKSFTDDPAIPGGTVTLEFTLDNSGSTVDATGINFTDTLSGVLSGLSSTSGTLTDVCGAGSQITGTTSLTFTGGNLLAGTSCTFSVTLDVPAGAANGVYSNRTSNLTATIGGTGVTLPPAHDKLTVTSDLLALAKSFTDDPVNAGDIVTLEFTLSNQDLVNGATAIGFTDDLNAALAGLAAVGLPASNVCGAGSEIAGTTLLTLTDGILPAGGSCTFSVTLQVPAGVAGSYTNTTSGVTGTIGGLGVSGDPASDDLLVQAMNITKTFDGPVGATGSAVLSFTIENLSTTETVSFLGFTDDLDAVLSGLVTTGLPADDVCGVGSVIAGTTSLTLTDGVLLPGGSCTINVTVQIPVGAAPGTYPNTTSELTSAGLKVAAPASADLQVEPAPGFAKAFAPDPITVGGVSTLTFTVDNTGSAIAATALAFSDNLPAAVTVANPSNAASSCGGAVTATPGSTVITFTGGTVGATATCTVTVDVVSTLVGTYVNPAAGQPDVVLTSSNGTSPAPATDTLTVDAAAGLDGDGDGVPDAVENLAPNDAGGLLGDGNNDGILDSLQSDVASIEGENDEYMTLITPAPTTFSGVASVPGPGAPAGVSFPWGFLSFQVDGVGPPGTVDVILIVHTQQTLLSYYKFGPEQVGAAATLYEFVLDLLTGTGFELAGNTFTLHFVDGGRGDDILTLINNNVLDDGAPAAANGIITVPTLGQWGLLALLLLLAAVGLYALPSRAARQGR